MDFEYTPLKVVEITLVLKPKTFAQTEQHKLKPHHQCPSILQATNKTVQSPEELNN